MRIVKIALAAAGLAGLVATATPASAAEFRFRIPGTPCVLYTTVDTRVDPQSTPPVDTEDTKVGAVCEP